MDSSLNRDTDSLGTTDNGALVTKTPFVKILFLSPDPRNAPRLRLGNELQEIRNRLAVNQNFEIRDRQAVKPNDVIQSIMEYEPNIVHFSGHGLETGELCFEDEQGYAAPVPADALSLLFKLAKDHVKCVIVNTCFSESQANAIAEYIPVVIGTKKEIGDKAAIGFSTGFYTALNPDLSLNSIQRAFELGKVAIQFGGSLDQDNAPVLIFGIPNLRFSSEVETAIAHISSVNTPDVTILKKVFSLKGKRMGLDAISVANIIEEKLQSVIDYNNRVIEYETTWATTLSEEFPLSEKTKKALQALKSELELRDDDATSVEEKILKNNKLDTAESWYDRGINQYKLGNYIDSIRYLTKASEKDPQYSGAHYNCGYSYFKLGNNAEAVAEFTKAIDINKKWEGVDNLISAYFQRGYVYYNYEFTSPEEQKQYKQKAFDDWTSTIQLSPKESVAYFNRGLVNDFFAKYAEACRDYESALSYGYAVNNDTERSRLLFKIAKAYENMGELARAQEFTNLGQSLLDKTKTTEDVPNSDEKGSTGKKEARQDGSITTGTDTMKTEEDKTKTKKKDTTVKKQKMPEEV